MSNAIENLPLQRKVFLTLLLVFAVFSALSYAILTGVIAPAFDDLDLSAARTNLVRAERAIKTDIENLEAITADWGPWDDIHDYARGINPGFRKGNLDRPTLTNLGLDVMAVYAVERELLWSQMRIEGEEHSIEELGIFGTDDPAYAVLTAHEQIESRTVGIVSTALGPMLISSRPIVRSDDSGPIAGAVIMGQFMNDERKARLAERTEVDLHWRSIEDFSHNHGIDPLAIADRNVHLEMSDTSVSAFVALSDIFGESLLVLDVWTPRQISALGEQTVNAAMLFLIITGIFVTAVIGYLLRGWILVPIEKLACHMVKIRESGDLSHRLELTGDDEIGALAAEFDNLTSEVHEARKALLLQSFKAGKADTAAEVLHNIRNAMTPMINGLERLAKSFKIAEDLRVGEATQQLSDPDCPPDRADKFIQYIDASFARVKAVNDEASEDMKVMQSQARQVEGILADQEKFANVAPLEEDIVVDEVVGEAAHVIPKAAKDAVDVELDEGLMRYRVRAHRIGLLQVLGNLILNAYESIQRGSKRRGRICLSASDTLVDDKPMVRLTVRDNGSGFDEDTSQRIFQRGFTSKSAGSTTGLGLHWCANAVAGMGGRISAESRGMGQGAEFHVLLPAAQGG
ncbi:MAG: ATP-binding protein [Gammaproteobacteria bacterium]|nr:ATP-binding protein [Gammaproteobacteria bacterium]MDH3750862.1 ATP-binding protein [Gammaproteobacteria bacterium]MDH3805952.1 ATP-binding protein [Gammaproteobacteria bacterium]